MRKRITEMLYPRELGFDETDSPPIDNPELEEAAQQLSKATGMHITVARRTACMGMVAYGHRLKP